MLNIRVNFVAIAAFLIVGCQSNGRSTVEDSETDSIADLSHQLEADDTTTFAVFVSAFACHDCFGQLDATLQSMRESFSPCRVVVIVRSEPSAIEKKSALRLARKTIEHADDVVLDVNSSSTPDPWPPENLSNGLFGEYDISITPALIVVAPTGHKSVYPYKSLFTDSLVNIDSSAVSNALRLSQDIRREWGGG